MRNKKFSMRNSRKQYNCKPHRNAKQHLWDQVGKEAPGLGYDSKKMSQRYHELEQKERRRARINTVKSLFKSKSKRTEKQSQKAKAPRSPVTKKIFLDGIRQYRSSTIISSVSNSLAKFVTQTTARKLSDSQRNILRAMVALAVSEAINKALEKELDTIEKVKTFVKIGKTVYKVVLEYDEYFKNFKSNFEQIKTPSYSLRYKFFLYKHPGLKKVYTNQACLSLMEIQSGKRCAVKERLDHYSVTSVNDATKTPNSCPYYFYCNS